MHITAILFNTRSLCIPQSTPNFTLLSYFMSAILPTHRITSRLSPKDQPSLSTSFPICVSLILEWLQTHTLAISQLYTHPLQRTIPTHMAKLKPVSYSFVFYTLPVNILLTLPVNLLHPFDLSRCSIDQA